VRVLRPDPGYPVLDVDGGTVLGPWGHTAVAPGIVVHELSCAEKGTDKRRTRRESDRSRRAPRARATRLRNRVDGRAIDPRAGLVAGAECVVAVHGVAMANLVFAPADATVVELVYRNWPITLYRDLCRTIGQRYHAVPGREPTLWRAFGTPALIDADTVVDVDALLTALDAAGVR